MSTSSRIDYAAVVREYHESGTTLSMAEWCLRKGFDCARMRAHNQQKYILPDIE